MTKKDNVEWVSRDFSKVGRIKDFRLRYVDWIDKQKKHHYRVFLDLLNMNNKATTLCYTEFYTKKEAFDFIHKPKTKVG